jgi:hypothetical protein
MSRDSFSSSPPFILSIPNEVIHHILSFLPDLTRDQPFVHYNSNGKDYAVAQMLVLRSVCRKFRAITAELDFWYDSEFLFADLATPVPFGEFMRPYYDQQFLKALFSDADFANSLGRRKTDWKFESIEGILAVIDGVPLFAENARALYLEILEHDEMRNLGSDPSTVDIAIDLLSECENVTTLDIRLAENVDLDEIAEAFPSLEIFRCSEAEQHSGSLQELDRLRKLYINSWSTDISTTLSLLPLNSAKTLTELKLDGGIVGNSVFNTDSLNVFVNLKSLNIGPLCDSICNFLIQAKFHLDAFETSLIRRHASKFANMLRAECLRDLKRFGLTNYHDDQYDPPATQRFWFLAFDAFTSILLSVEEVQLCVPLHLQCCPYFARMINLKLLNWDGTTNPSFGCPTGSHPTVQIQRALDTAFSNFMEKPQVAVHFI